MNSKISLIAAASVIALTASACSGTGFRGSTQGGSNVGVNTSGTGQMAKRGFGQQRSSANAVDNSCAICAASKAQTTYTYKPAQPVAQAPTVRPVTVAKPRPTSTHNQQYYIDRWNRQQQQQQQAQQNTNYSGYGQTGSNATYYDYSSASKAPAPVKTATTNKSIYTGSYQQKPYTPATYTGGTAASTVTNVSATGAGSYTVKKGDTVFEIMRQTGVYWKDIININSLQPPYNINPGQTLRLK